MDLLLLSDKQDSGLLELQTRLLCVMLFLLITWRVNQNGNKSNKANTYEHTEMASFIKAMYLANNFIGIERINEINQGAA